MRNHLPLLLFVIALVASSCGSSSGDSTTSSVAPSEATTTSATATAAPAAPGDDAEHDSAFVQHLQEELNHLGYHSGHVDGVWGQHTSDALAAFQADRSLEETGHYDAETASALQEAAGDADALSVEALQQKLEELGYYAGLVDGDYGTATEDAVRAFQSSEGLSETGTLDHDTMLAISAKHATEVEQAHIDAAKTNNIGGVENLPAANTVVPDNYMKQGSEGADVKVVQDRLVALGYLPGTADGRFGAATASAVMAFQKHEGLQRDSIVGPEVEDRLANPKGAGPKKSDSGPRVEVDLDRQIMFAIDSSGDVTIINVSSGSGKQYQSAEAGKGIVTAHTPTGEFVIQRSIDGNRKAPLGTLYRPLYFDGGWAIHGNPHVPGYPASHGCVRTANWDQDFVWTVITDGNPVWIYGHNPDTPANASAGA